MVSWGIFKTDDPYLVHVAPCDEQGDIAESHVLDMSCPCIGRVELSAHGVEIVVHEEVN